MGVKEEETRLTLHEHDDDDDDDDDDNNNNNNYNNNNVYNFIILNYCTHCKSRSQWPRGLRRRSTAARPLRLWVQIPPGAWMFVCCECCVLSGRGICD